MPPRTGLEVANSVRPAVEMDTNTTRSSSMACSTAARHRAATRSGRYSANVLPMAFDTNSLGERGQSICSSRPVRSNRSNLVWNSSGMGLPPALERGRGRGDLVSPRRFATHTSPFDASSGARAACRAPCSVRSLPHLVFGAERSHLKPCACPRNDCPSEAAIRFDTTSRRFESW